MVNREAWAFLSAGWARTIVLVCLGFAASPGLEPKGAANIYIVRAAPFDLGSPFKGETSERRP